MKSITVSVPDEVYERVRIRAFESGRTIDTLVADYLNQLSEQASDFGRLESLQHEVQAEIVTFKGNDRLKRDLVHDRAFH